MESKEKVTVSTVTDDLMGGLLIGTGGIGTAALVKGVNAKFKLHPLVVAFVALALGIAARMSSNLVADKKIKESIKDLSSGMIAVASVDSAIKLLDMVYPAWRNMLPRSLQTALPTALGEAPAQEVIEMQQVDNTTAYQMLNGLGEVQTAWQMIN